MPLLSLEAVTRSFGGLAAVADLSFAAGAGRITGLIGPNGAGKTTVINLVTGLLRLSGGRVLLDGQDVSREPPQAVARLGIARTFQNIRLLPEQSVLENVAAGFYRHEAGGLAAALLGLPAARAARRRTRDRAGALLARFGMSAQAGLPAGALAYGHQRRVEIMRALATGPRLLLLDEPVAGMNDVEAEGLGHTIQQLAQEGMGILLVEHNMRFVTGVCDTVHVLDAGRLIASGAPDAVIADPLVIEAYLGIAA
jgi:branched-chain amino acid transport system ATP-binding protein